MTASFRRLIRSASSQLGITLSPSIVAHADEVIE
jgi:hypothetical protein